jgi:hypothetical protein
MVCNEAAENEYEAKFVISFIQERRQTRYLEMLEKGKREKFLDEMCSRMANHLEPRTTLYCRTGVSIHEIARVCPKVSMTVWCHMTDYDRRFDNRAVKTTDLYSDPDALINSNASIITFLAGELALYCFEGHVALCCRLKGFSGTLASHPLYRDVVDRTWRIQG